MKNWRKTELDRPRQKTRAGVSRAGFSVFGAGTPRAAPQIRLWARAAALLGLDRELADAQSAAQSRYGDRALTLQEKDRQQQLALTRWLSEQLQSSRAGYDRGLQSLLAGQSKSSESVRAELEQTLRGLRADQLAAQLNAL